MQEAAYNDFDAGLKADEATTLRTLNAFAVDLMTIPTVEDLFWYVAQNVVGPLGFSDCVIYEANDQQTELVQVAALGEKNPFGRSILNPLKIPFGQGITGQVAETRESIVVNDLTQADGYIADTQPARSEICVPLVCGNQVVGVIDSEDPELNAFGASEKDILTTIAALTSAKLELLAEADRSKQRYQGLVDAHAQLSLEGASRKALETELFKAKKLETVGRLTGKFAHEFNNLLTVISGNLEFLEGDLVDSVGQDSLRAAQVAAERASKLISSMLTYSQRTRLDPEAVNLNQFIKAVVGKPEAEVNGPIRLELQDEVWPVNADVSILETVALNLIANARDAMPGGGGIHVQVENVVHKLTDKRNLTTLLRSGPYVRLSIRDSGKGISEESLQQIFDPFFTTKMVGEGTGLGLSMTLGFMQQSGGTVEVTSSVGEGATFALYFPAIVT